MTLLIRQKLHEPPSFNDYKTFLVVHFQHYTRITFINNSMQVIKTVMASVSSSIHLSHLSVSSAPELSPEPSAAAGTFPRILVYPVFEPQSRGKPGCQAASPGCQRSNLRAPPGKCRLSFQESCPGRWLRSSRGKRSWRGKVSQFYLMSFYISSI